MKLPIAILIALPLISTSCKKDSDQEGDNGCIERVYVNKNEHTINSADIPTVNKLFADNKIDNSNFRYWKYRHDSLETQYPPYEKIDHKHVRVDEYVKGLRVISSDVIFNFKKDVFSYTSGSFSNVPVNNTLPFLSLPRIRQMFLEDVENNGSGTGTNVNYTDSCLCAELGLYIIRNNGNSAAKAVKVWLVTSKNRSFPRAIYNDDGTRISYDNGIRTFTF